MKHSRGKRNLSFLAILIIALGALAALSNARTSRTPATAVNIVNSSNKEIRNVYISHVSQDDWSDNQLGGAIVSSGQSFALNNVACDQEQVKVIAEDGDGCFASTVVSCGQSSTWTITNDTARDCGQ
jgi:FlaG/FlaF family flagellin (archaellin)